MPEGMLATLDAAATALATQAGAVDGGGGSSGSGGKSGGKGRGRGKGKGKGKPAHDTKIKTVVEKMVPVLVDLDRRLATMEDRSSIVFVIKTEAAKKKIIDIIALWRKRNDEARVAYEAGGDDAVFAHPMGCPLRVCIVMTLVEIMQDEIKGGTGHEFTSGFLALGNEIIARTVFRARPRHIKPKEDYAWVWSVLFSENLEGRKGTEHLKSLKAIRLKECYAADMHSQDGPLVKWMLEWRRAVADEAKKAEHADTSADAVQEEYNEEGRSKAQRRKRGTA